MVGNLDVGLGPMVNANSTGLTGDAWVSVFDSGGAPIWAKAFGDASTQDLAKVAVDPVSGEIVVAGLLTGSIDFGGGSVSSSYGTYLGRLDAKGNHVSSRAVSSLQSPRGLVVDGSGTTLAGVSAEPGQRRMDPPRSAAALALPPFIGAAKFGDGDADPDLVVSTGRGRDSAPGCGRGRRASAV
jgi:hypothetical protein